MSPSSKTDTGFRLWQVTSRTESHPKPISYSNSPIIPEIDKKDVPAKKF